MRVRDLFDPRKADQLLRLHEAGAILNYSENRLSAVLREFGVPTIKQSGVIFVRVDDLAEFVDRRGIGYGPRRIEQLAA